MHKQLQATITVLSLIKPAICATMFARDSRWPSSVERKPLKMAKLKEEFFTNLCA
jgi:hypothetical protein